jgi:hypothetical protein
MVRLRALPGGEMLEAARDWLNKGVFIGVAARGGAGVICETHCFA